MMLFRMLFDGTMNRRRSTGTPRKQGRRGSRANHHQGQARDPPLCEENDEKTQQRHPPSLPTSQRGLARATPRKATLEPGPRAAEALVATVPPSVHLVEPNCFYFKGMKVEIIDWSTKVFVIDLVPPAVCDLLRSTIAQHCLTQRRNGQLTWRTLYTYTKMDLPCCEIAKVQDIAQQLIDNINGLLTLLFAAAAGKQDNNNNNDNNNGPPPIILRPRSWKEPHFLRYEHLDNNNDENGHGRNNGHLPRHVGVESHYDGSDFTWSLMLSRPDEYKGGGTYIRTLRTTLRLDQGQVLLHPGDLYHTGLDITSGVRELMICFMDGWDSMTRDLSHENDVCEVYQRNLRQTHFGQP